MNYRLLVVLTIFLFTSCKRYVYVAGVKHDSYRIERTSYPVDVAIAKIVEPYKVKLDETMNVVIGNNPSELIKGKPSSSLTNWFADAVLIESRKNVDVPIDFSLQNYGGIRINSLAQGEVTVGSIYELMPFDNLLYLAKIDGANCKILFDKIAQSNGWPISHTVSFEIKYGEAHNININGQPLDMTQTYTIALPDYVAQGGDNMSIFDNAVLTDTGILIRDLLISHVQSNPSFEIITSPRITIP